MSLCESPALWYNWIKLDTIGTIILRIKLETSWNAYDFIGSRFALRTPSCVSRFATMAAIVTQLQAAASLVWDNKCKMQPFSWRWWKASGIPSDIFGIFIFQVTFLGRIRLLLRPRQWKGLAKQLKGRNPWVASGSVRSCLLSSDMSMVGIPSSWDPTKKACRAWGAWGACGCNVATTWKHWLLFDHLHILNSVSEKRQQCAGSHTRFFETLAWRLCYEGVGTKPQDQPNLVPCLPASSLELNEMVHCFKYHPRGFQNSHSKTSPSELLKLEENQIRHTGSGTCTQSVDPLFLGRRGLAFMQPLYWGKESNVVKRCKK
jgi:hypothetical protein